jgi:hypothetical protein
LRENSKATRLLVNLLVNRHAKQEGEQCARSHDLLLIAHAIAQLETLRCSLEYCHPQLMPVPE